MYTLVFSKEARKFIRRQDAHSKQRLQNALLELAEDPFTNPQVKRLRGIDSMLRLRVGDLRVVFSIEHDKLMILVVSIGNRGDVYNNL